MNPIVLSLKPSEIKHLVTQFLPFEVTHQDPNKIHFFKIKDTSISVYRSGKVMFQGKNASEVAGPWLHSNQLAHHTISINQNLVTIGSDEVGNGSYFGGIAVVASLVKPEQHSRLKQLGVDDSKSLTDQKILQIAPVLECEIEHQALLLSPQKYNDIIPSRYNAVSVKVALHNQAIFLLLQKTETPEQIIIDAFTSKANYDKYLKQEVNHFDHPIRLVEKAEGQCLAVAVSSIIARSLFLRQLKELSQKIGYDLPSGAGAPSDNIASKLLTTYGDDILLKTAKYHFKNTEKAYALTRRNSND